MGSASQWENKVWKPGTQSRIVASLALDQSSPDPDSIPNSPAYPVDLEEIRKIVELMEEHGLSLFHLEQEGVNVKLKKAPDPEALREALGGLALTPGVQMAAPAPDADDFVQVGDRISEGQTVCIIEAMKVMNEIKAEVSGTVSEICVDDSSSVQYGDTLFRVT